MPLGIKQKPYTPVDTLLSKVPINHAVILAEVGPVYLLLELVEIAEWIQRGARLVQP